MRNRLLLNSHLDWHFQDEKSLSQYFVALKEAAQRASCQDAKSICRSALQKKHFKRICLGVDTCYAVRIVTFISKKPNLTALKSVDATMSTVVTVLFTTCYGSLSFWEKQRISIITDALSVWYGQNPLTYPSTDSNYNPACLSPIKNHKRLIRKVREYKR